MVRVKRLLNILPATWGAGCTMLSSLLLGGCTESLYLTTPIPINDDRYELIAPYVTEVNTKFTVQIIQVPGQDPTTPATTTATIGVIPVPVSRAYLYLAKNSLFSDTVNVSVGSDGLLTSSDSSSAQQVTAILTELGQTAGAIALGPFYAATGVRSHRKEPTLGSPGPA